MIQFLLQSAMMFEILVVAREQEQELRMKYKVKIKVKGLKLNKEQTMMKK